MSFFLLAMRKKHTMQLSQTKAHILKIERVTGSRQLNLRREYNKLLLQGGEKGRGLFATVQFLDVLKTKELLQTGHDAKQKNDSDETPLHMIGLGKMDRYKHENADINIAKLLLNNGADINAKDDIGTTPLHVAAEYKSARPELVRFLIQNGADVRAVDSEGRTPLHIVAEEAREDRPVHEFREEFDGWLRNMGSLLANVDHSLLVAKDNNGKTPLDVYAIDDTLFQIQFLKAVDGALKKKSTRRASRGKKSRKKKKATRKKKN
jgi:ankyrin repeat protein